MPRITSQSSSSINLIGENIKETNVESPNKTSSKLGTKRVIAAIFTLGLSEAVRAIQSYHTRRAEHHGPQATKKESQVGAGEGMTPLNEAARRHNYGVIHKTLDPNQASPFPEAAQHAMEKAQSDLRPVVTFGSGNLLGQSLNTLQMRLPEIPEPFTHELFEKELVKEIKLNILKNSFSDNLKEELIQRNIPPQPEFITQLQIVETPTLTNLANNIPKEEIPRLLTALISKSANIIQNAHHSKIAREEVLGTYRRTLMTNLNISELEAKNDNGYKMLETRLTESNAEIQNKEQTKHPGKSQVIPLHIYQKAFLEIANPFLAIFSVTETKD